MDELVSWPQSYPGGNEEAGVEDQAHGSSNGSGWLSMIASRSGPKPLSNVTVEPPPRCGSRPQTRGYLHVTLLTARGTEIRPSICEEAGWRDQGGTIQRLTANRNAINFETSHESLLPERRLSLLLSLLRHSGACVGLIPTPVIRF